MTTPPRFRPKKPRKPALTRGIILRKRTKEERDQLLLLLRNPKHITRDERDTYAAMLLLDVAELDEDQLSQLDKVMRSPDERRRIGAALSGLKRP